MTGTEILLLTTAAATVAAVAASAWLVDRAGRALPDEEDARAAALLRLHKQRVQVASGMLLVPLVVWLFGGTPDAGGLLAPVLLLSCVSFELRSTPAALRLQQRVRGERWSVRLAMAQTRWQLAAQFAVPLFASLGVASLGAIGPTRDPQGWALDGHLIGVLAGLLVSGACFARLGKLEPLPEEHAAPVRAVFGETTPTLLILRTQGDGMWNAYAFGLLPKRRKIFVSEDLLTLLTPDEVHAVLCHEVGHHRRRHLILRTVLFASACIVPAVVAAAMGVLSPNVSAAGPLFLLLLMSWLWQRQEREADRFAAEHASAAALGAGLAKMTRARFLPAAKRAGATHPSLDERLRALGLPVSAPAPIAAADGTRR